MTDRLLAVTAMRLEAHAVRRGAPEAEVIRTGIGPKRAARAAGRQYAGAAVAFTGFCGSVGEARPGDVVVASEICDGDSRMCVPTQGLLVDAIRRAGHRVFVGPIESSDHIVRGSERNAIRSRGVVAVDMETAWVLPLAAGRPHAVVRIVSDSPSGVHIPGTLVRARHAHAVLQDVASILNTWGASVSARDILLAGPRSFCAGVERAIETVERAIERFGPPVFVRKQIVHNRHVVEDLAQRGAVFVDDLEEVPPGAVVVLSAHGVSPAVRRDAHERALTVIDATCPLVSKVHAEVRRFSSLGYSVVLIGHRGHDEVEGTLGESDSLQVAGSAADVDEIIVADPSRVAYVTQTTLAPSDTDGVIAGLKERFPDLVGPPASDICFATKNRQEALGAIAGRCDLVLVIGSPNSSNTCRLVEIATRLAPAVQLIDDPTDLELASLRGATTIGITAGASAPEHLVRRVVDLVSDLGPTRVHEVDVAKERVAFPLPEGVR